MKRQAYFTRLLTHFFLVAMVPLLLAGTAFYTAGMKIILDANEQRGKDALAVSVSRLEKQLEIYRHIAYSLSKETVVAHVFQFPEQQRSSRWLKELYSTLYEGLSGHLYEISIHLVSDDGRSSYSSHQLAEQYDLSDYGNIEGIFSEPRPDPDKSYLYLQPFYSKKGERVLCSFLRELEGGYLILDILAEPLMEAAGQQIFNSLIMLDTKRLLAVDFFRPDRDGTFDHFQELETLPLSFHDLKRGKSLRQEDTLLLAEGLSEPSLLLLASLAVDPYEFALSALWRFGFWTILVLFVLIVLLAYKMSRDIGEPVHRLAKAMEYLSDGTPPEVPESRRQDEMAYLVSSYNQMVRRMEELLQRTREEEQALRLAERRALQAQVQPHFLYNTLGTIKSIAKLKGVPEIVHITTALGKMLRDAVGDGEAFISLRENIHLLKNYIDIQRYRFGERLDVHFDLEDGLEDFLLPKLMLQPLVENAVLHGMEASTAPVRIDIIAKRRGNGMELCIQDNGPGFDLGSRGKRGIGLQNVQRRMDLYYQGEGSFRIDSSPGTGTRLHLFFPGERL